MITCSIIKNGKSYSIAFRHPIVRDKSGKYGLRVMRGLKTKDLEQAQLYQKQIQELVNDKNMYDLSKKELALTKYDKIVVDAFYDPFSRASKQIAYKEYISIENTKKATLLSKNSDAKNELIKLLLGYDGNFYSKLLYDSTPYNTEILLSPNAEKPEISIDFKSKFYIDSCLTENINLAFENAVKEIEEQRLVYLRDWLNASSDEDTDTVDLADEIQTIEDNILTNITKRIIENNITGINLREIFGNVDSIECFNSLDRNNFILFSKLADSISEIAKANNELSKEVTREIKSTIIESINASIGHLKENDIVINKTEDYVSSCYIKADNIDDLYELIDTITYKYKSLISNIRIKTKCNIKSEVTLFFPGNNTNSTISSNTLRYINNSDFILLLEKDGEDNEGLKEYISSIFNYGMEEKTSIIYIGDNKGKISKVIEDYQNEMKINSVFNSKYDDFIDSKVFLYKDIESIEKNIIKQNTPSVHHLPSLNINEDELYDYIRDANNKFRNKCNELIGYPFKKKSTATDSDIKNFTKLLAYFDINEYKNLAPVVDFREELIYQLNIFINNLISNNQTLSFSDICLLKQNIAQEISKLSKTIIWENQRVKWIEAYEISGENEAYERGLKINKIMDLSVPRLPQSYTQLNDFQKKYYDKIVDIINKAIK